MARKAGDPGLAAGPPPGKSSRSVVAAKEPGDARRAVAALTGAERGGPADRRPRQGLPSLLGVPPHQRHGQHRDAERDQQRDVEGGVEEGQQDHQAAAHADRRSVAAVDPEHAHEEAEVQRGAHRALGDEQQPQLPGAADVAVATLRAARRLADRDRLPAALGLAGAAVAEDRRLLDGGQRARREEGADLVAVAALSRAEIVADSGDTRTTAASRPAPIAKIVTSAMRPRSASRNTM